MKSQFDQTLNLKHSDETVRAKGDLNWGEIDPGWNAVKVIATIRQDGVEGKKTSRSYSRGEGTWDCDVDASNGGSFAPGDSDAHGRLVNSEHPDLDPFEWNATPTLA
jgi:hypothetical protein